MTLPVAPELFDLLPAYAKEMQDGKITVTPSLASTSPAVVFCQNFYLQFFQNRLNKEITRFDSATKKTAVELRLEIKDAHGPRPVILLITWFEKLCDIYPNLLALGYGVATKTIFLDFHNNYLLILLERASTCSGCDIPHRFHRRLSRLALRQDASAYGSCRACARLVLRSSGSRRR